MRKEKLLENRTAINTSCIQRVLHDGAQKTLKNLSQSRGVTLSNLDGEKVLASYLKLVLQIPALGWSELC